jgi:hypothetical protein
LTTVSFYPSELLLPSLFITSRRFVGQYDTALQLCLKPEFAKYTLGKALMAYTHCCLRNYTKALEIARLMACTQPIEPSVVSTLGCTFKAARAETDFADLYENAMKKKAMPESYVLELFACYCRQYNPKQMQFVAQKLHKAAPDRHEYLYWSIACMLLQDLPPTMLVLAEKMTHKVMYEIYNEYQPSAEEHSMYAFILARQGKFAEAYDQLVSLRQRKHGYIFADEPHFHRYPHYVKMVELQFQVHKADLLIRQGRFAEVVTEAKEVLKTYPDQWSMHKVIVDCLLATEGDAPGAAALSAPKLMTFPMQDLSELLKQVQSGAASTGTAVTTAHVQAVLQHQTYLLQLQGQHAKLRGPYLAELYLLSTWATWLRQRQTDGAVTEAAGSAAGLWRFPEAPEVVLQGAATKCPTGTVSDAIASLVGELGNLIARYAVRFHTKQCCFSDLKPYIVALQDCDTPRNQGANQALTTALKEWAIAQRAQLNSKLLAALQELVAEKRQASGKFTEAAQLPLPPPLASNISAGTGDAPATAPTTTATADADEGEEDGEEGPDKAESGASGTAGTAGAGAAAGTGGGKKKKNKKKKKSATTAAAGTSEVKADPTTATKAPLDNTLALKVSGEYTEVLLPLCGYCKFDQIAAFCDTLLLWEATSPASAAAAAQENQEVEFRGVIYGAMREVFSKGLGEEPRNLQPGDELLLQNSSLHRRRFACARAAQLTATGTGTRTGMEQDPAAAAAVRWIRCLLRGSAASPYSAAFRMDLLEPYRALGMGEAASIAYSEIKPKHIQVGMSAPSRIALSFILRLSARCYQ